MHRREEFVINSSGSSCGLCEATNFPAPGELGHALVTVANRRSTCTEPFECQRQGEHVAGWADFRRFPKRHEME